MKNNKTVLVFIAAVQKPAVTLASDMGTVLGLPAGVCHHLTWPLHTRFIL